jgi:hypothetical protein
MKKVIVVLILSMLLVGCDDARLKCWRVDPLTKIFPDDSRDTSQSGDVIPLLARNGHASIQIAVFSEAGIADLKAVVEMQSPIVAQVRHVGYVPVASNPPKTPEDELARPAPSLYPDPLLEAFPFPLKAKRTEAIWVTLYAPSDTQPGEYSGKVALSAGGEAISTQHFKVKVTKATVPAVQSLQVTNWLTLEPEQLASHFKTGEDPEAYWRVLGNLGRVMADHRQNVLLTPVMTLAGPKIEGAQIRYDFAKFDRWVNTFQKAGVIGTIEGGHILGRLSGYQTSMIVPAYVIDGGKVVQKQLSTDDPRAEQFLKSFLSALYAHLKEKGWTDRYIQHIHDEPHDQETTIYNRYAKIARKNLPGIPTIDAVGLDQGLGFFEDVSDIWVPVLGSFDGQLDKIQAHVAKGGHAWFYTCIEPQGRHLNRFIDYPLLKTQLLHWFNFRHNLTGFLHWGGNYWGPEPFLDVQPVINNNVTLLPAGDNAIIYPNPSKESVFSSIRLEAMREGIEDYELLSALSKRDPEKAKRLAATAIPHITDYIRSVPRFRALQHELMEE